jgi:hypothetical protein
MDPLTLTETVVAFLAPYIAKSGEKFAEEVGKKLPEGVSQLWGAITKKFKRKTQAEDAMEGFSANPDKLDNRIPFRTELKKALIEDLEFRREVEQLLENANRINVTDTNQSAIATDGGLAASAGGVAVGGNVAGGIHIYQQGPSLHKRATSSGSGTAELDQRFSEYMQLTIERYIDRQSNFPQDLQRNLLDFYIEARGAREPLSKDQTNASQSEDLWKLITPCVEKGQPCIILADFGLGKTWFLEMIQYRLARQITSKIGLNDASRIPLLLTLRNFRPEVVSPGLANKFMSLVGDRSRSIFEQLRDQAWISAIGESITYSQSETLTRLFEDGRFLFLFDALDETTLDSKGDRDSMITEIGKISMQTKRSPVILTCRRSFFRDPAQEKSLRDRGFEVFYLWPWSHEQIFAYIEKTHATGILKISPQDAMKTLENTYDLRDISSRALLSSMLVEQWEDFAKGQAVDLPSLYERHIERATLNWQGRKTWQLEEHELRKYMEELAFLMFELNSYQLSPEDLDKYFSQKFTEFKIEKFSRVAESLVRDIKTNSLLLREDNHYVFCHLSIWEFFVARKLVRALEQDDGIAFLIASRATQYRSIIKNFVIPILTKQNKISLISSLFNNI